MNRRPSIVMVVSDGDSVIRELPAQVSGFQIFYLLFKVA